MTVTALYASQPNNKPVFNEFISPIGKIIHCYHDKPQLETDDKTKQPIIDPKTGIQKANFKVTLMWTKAEKETILMPMRHLAGKVVDETWGVGSINDPWLALQAFLRDGDNPEHNTMKREYLFGHVYLNFKGKAVPVLDTNGVFQNRYTGSPELIGPYQETLMPVDVYAGCWGRVSGIMFGTEYMGKRFVSTRLNNIQKGGGPNGDGNGERIGGAGRPDAKSQFDPLVAGPMPGSAVSPGAGQIRNLL